MRRLTISIILCIFGLLLTGPVVSGQSASTAYTWETGDLSLLLPEGWSVVADDPALQLEAGSMRLTIATGPRNPAALEPLVPLQEALGTHGYVLLDYTNEVVFGLPGIRAAITSSQRALTGSAIAGWSPDGRVIVLLGGAPSADRLLWDDAFAAVLASLTFSADSPPAPRLYRPIWRMSDSLSPDTTSAGIVALDAFEDRLYAVAPGRGVIVLDAQDGAVISESAFPNPAQPTDIAVTADAIYISDTVCRCLLRQQADGTWLDPIGAFGPNAPLRLAAHPDGTLLAIDSSSDGYALQLVQNNAAETIPLNFNAAAPPLLALAPDGTTALIEWLTSLLDSSTSGALFTLEADEPELVRWLPVTPDDLRDVAALSDGQIIYALADGAIAVTEVDDSLNTLLRAEAPVRRLTIGDDGLIYALLDGGLIVAYSNQGVPDRTGHPILLPGIPVVGAVSETAPSQQWRYQGTAGERITLNAIDPGIQVGLDVALRLFAPDGRELAYNDDHLGPDLSGIYDAQIREFILPQTGTYTIQAEWVQFSGSYALLLARDHTFALQADAPIALAGRILAVQPVERWVFNGSAGTALTVTMVTESGDLDPTLELIDPYGVTLAYNDDGRDPELGTNAQLFRVTLPVEGQYVIEASRYSGTGDYSMIVIMNSGG